MPATPTTRSSPPPAAAAAEALSPQLGPAFLLACRALGDSALAEDAVQEALLRVTARPPRDLGAKALGVYFLRAVHGVAVDLARGEAARRAREELFAVNAKPPSARPDQAAAANEAALAARRELDLLPPELRTAVCLCCEEGFSQSEAAEVLGVPLGTVARRVQRGLESLRERLTKAGFAALGPAALAGMLGGLGVPPAPASLTACLERLAHGTKRTALGRRGAGGARKGGLIVKIGAGIAAAALVAGGIFWAVGGPSSPSEVAEGLRRTGKSEESAKPPETPKSKFATPVTDPNAEWESSGIYSSSGAQGDLDGPRLDYMTRNHSGFGPCGGPGWSGNETTCLSYNSKLDRFVTAAGSAMGYLDGPFSRARFMGNSYTARGLATASPDGRYLYITEPRAGQALRCLDLVKQEVRTLLPDTKDIKGLVAGKKGLYAFKAGWEATTAEFLVLDSEAKVQKKITLQIDGKLGGWGCATALDEEHERVYGSRSFDSGIPWYVWYWDLKDGSFHGVVPMPKKGEPTHQTGPFEGTELYPELGIGWVPGDPDRRFLLAGVTDMGAPVLFDLVDREVRTLAKTSDGHVKWVGKGARVGNLYQHGGLGWLPDGSFFHSMGGGGPLFQYKRIK